MKTCHLDCRANLFVVSVVAALGLLALSGFASEAKDPMNSKPWSFNVRNNATALSKAMMQWNAERLDAQGGNAAAGAGGAGLPSAGGAAGATANYSTITVILDDGATGTVEIGTNQESQGNQSATATSATINEATIPTDGGK